MLLVMLVLGRLLELLYSISDGFCLRLQELLKPLEGVVTGG